MTNDRRQDVRALNKLFSFKNFKKRPLEAVRKTKRVYNTLSISGSIRSLTFTKELDVLPNQLLLEKLSQE